MVGRCAALVAVVVVAVCGYHAHRPSNRPTYPHPEDEQPATSQDNHGTETPDSKTREQRETVHLRPRRYVGDGHIGIKIDQDTLSGTHTHRPSLIVCEQLVVLRHTSPAGNTVSCTFSDRLMTPEARAHQVARWGQRGKVALQFVSVDVFMNIVQECLRLEESPKPPPPNWNILSLLQIRAPGTLWCGSGQTAEDLSELGAWGPVDHCCRLHDLCPVQLLPYVHYRGAINVTPKPLSHCSCDALFASCLYEVNNRRASFIFHTYFNVLFRRGFCATIHPRQRRMGFTRSFHRLWAHLVNMYESMSEPHEEDTHRKKRKAVTSTARQLESTSVFLPTNTTRTASSLSVMDSTPSLTKPPETRTLSPFSSSTSPFPCLSLFSSSISSSSSVLSAFLTTTFHNNKRMTTLQTSQQEPDKKSIGFTSLLLKRIFNTCISDSLTTTSVLQSEVVSKSISPTPSPTPPLPDTVKAVKALSHTKEADPKTHLYENTPGKLINLETSKRHEEHEAHDTGIHEHEKVTPFRRVNESSHDNGQRDNVIQVISFKRYLEECRVEEENDLKGDKLDEGKKEEEEEEKKES